MRYLHSKNPPIWNAWILQTLYIVVLFKRWPIEETCEWNFGWFFIQSLLIPIRLSAHSLEIEQQPIKIDFSTKMTETFTRRHYKLDSSRLWLHSLNRRIKNLFCSFWKWIWFSCVFLFSLSLSLRIFVS